LKAACNQSKFSEKLVLCELNINNNYYIK